MHILTRYQKFGVYDTETTGLTAHQACDLEMQPRIIEFAGIITDGHEILDTVEFIVNPQMPIEEIITRITGLTNADLKDKPIFETKLDVLSGYFGACDATIAHNASFDRDLLLYDLQRCGKTLDDIKFPKMNICTVEQTFHMFGKYMRLEQLYRLFCGPYEQKHRALDDILLLHKVCMEIDLYNTYKGVS